MPPFLKTLFTVALALAAGWCVYRVLRRWWESSDDRPALAGRWAVTGVLFAVLAFFVGPLVGRGGYAGAFVGIPLTAVVGLILAIVWVPDMAGWVGRKFGRLYDGGDVAPDAEPLFSIVEARRKQGRYAAAADAMREQLERFPTHFRAQMVLAEILAGNLDDLDGAAGIIETILAQEGHPTRNLCYALTCLADWRLKYRKDVAGARECFERIIERFPDTDEDHRAQQRLARLAGTEGLLARPPVRLEAPRADPHLGTRAGGGLHLRPVRDPAAEAERLVQQLDQFPHDNRAREELALLYVEEFQRPDLAAEQLEQLIDQPHAPQRDVVRWLNLLADYALKSPTGLPAAQAALRRLIDRFPESAGAAAAKRRLGLLGYEARKAQTSQTVRFGSSAPKPPPAAEE
ncbi:MAG: tetratricopeptide repeat protein [Verrucomicrobiales bacterium]|nr:tetratricopeptide repeat protein [Verrucomicrobiales bacterium]